MARLCEFKIEIGHGHGAAAAADSVTGKFA